MLKVKVGDLVKVRSQNHPSTLGRVWLVSRIEECNKYNKRRVYAYFVGVTYGYQTYRLEVVSDRERI